MDPMFHPLLQGLDFWVEPQGGHIADEDQDRVKRTRNKGGGSGKRDIRKTKKTVRNAHIHGRF